MTSSQANHCACANYRLAGNERDRWHVLICFLLWCPELNKHPNANDDKSRWYRGNKRHADNTDKQQSWEMKVPPTAFRWFPTTATGIEVKRNNSAPENVCLATDWGNPPSPAYKTAPPWCGGWCRGKCGTAVWEIWLTCHLGLQLTSHRCGWQYV